MEAHLEEQVDMVLLNLNFTTFQFTYIPHHLVELVDMVDLLEDMVDLLEDPVDMVDPLVDTKSTAY